MRLFFIILLLAFSLRVAAQDNWRPVVSDERVTVFTTLLPGKKYLSFKAVAIVRASPQALRSVLDDVESYEHWFAYCKTARRLKSTGNERHVYMETDFPWPFSNEDMVYQVSVRERANGSIKYWLTGKPSYAPIVKGVARMRASHGYIVLKPEDDYTEVTYVMHTEPGGNIPVWLANQNVQSLPSKTLRNLIERVENDLP